MGRNKVCIFADEWNPTSSQLSLDRKHRNRVNDVARRFDKILGISSGDSMYLLSRFSSTIRTVTSKAASPITDMLLSLHMASLSPSY